MVGKKRLPSFLLRVQFCRECDNYLEGEQMEMIELYQQKGLSKEDACEVVSILSKNKPLFVDVMMKEELELLPPEGLDAITNGKHFSTSCLSTHSLPSCSPIWFLSSLWPPYLGSLHH